MFGRACLLVLLATLTQLIDSVTITLESQLPFSRVLPNYNDEKSFVRLHKNRMEVLNCPENFVFDSKELKCVLSSAEYDNNNVETVKCAEKYAGTLPNTKNCRTYVDCWYGLGYIMPCPAHLLFNNETKQCDWPEAARCCEFWENDDSGLIVDV